MSDGTSSCPCGCGAELIGMVAERETGLRAETTGPAPVRKLPASEHSAAYLITGMPGAGKSTVARLLALHFDHAAHIDIDMVFHHFTVSGRAEPAASTAGSERQADLSVLNAATMARNYLGAGYVCVLEGAIARRSQVSICEKTLAPHVLQLVVLAPPLTVSEARDAERSGKHVAEYFRHLHPSFDEELGGMGLWIDNSRQSPLGTVQLILAHRGAEQL